MINIPFLAKTEVGSNKQCFFFVAFEHKSHSNIIITIATLYIIK